MHHILPTAQGVCHRDLKLENTLLDGRPAPRLKICDFGYSKVGARPNFQPTVAWGGCAAQQVLPPATPAAPRSDLPTVCGSSGRLHRLIWHTQAPPTSYIYIQLHLYTIPMRSRASLTPPPRPPWAHPPTSHQRCSAATGCALVYRRVLPWAEALRCCLRLGACRGHRDVAAHSAETHQTHVATLAGLFLLQPVTQLLKIAGPLQSSLPRSTRANLRMSGPVASRCTPCWWAPTPSRQVGCCQGTMLCCSASLCAVHEPNTSSRLAVCLGCNVCCMPHALSAWLASRFHLCAAC